MAKFKICPKCGAHLDSGEKCGCDTERAEDARIRKIRAGDIVFCTDTDETFKVLGINYERRLIIPEDDIDKRYRAESVELIRSCGETQTYEQIDRLRSIGAVSYIERN